LNAGDNGRRSNLDAQTINNQGMNAICHLIVLTDPSIQPGHEDLDIEGMVEVSHPRGLQTKSGLDIACHQSA
jgi:hypothetical protein